MLINISAYCNFLTHGLIIKVIPTRKMIDFGLGVVPEQSTCDPALEHKGLRHQIKRFSFWKKRKSVEGAHLSEVWADDMGCFKSFFQSYPFAKECISRYLEIAGFIWNMKLVTAQRLLCHPSPLSTVQLHKWTMQTSSNTWIMYGDNLMDISMWWIFFKLIFYILLSHFCDFFHDKLIGKNGNT